MARPLFPKIGRTGGPPKSYQEFWNTLSRDTTRYEFYRAHQLKLLEEYEKVPSGKKDVAICLPTGSGKTVVALSIAGFAQLQRKRRVLYLCPTIQLASQVLDEAKGLGISAVDLTGPWGSLLDEQKESYYLGSSIGVATYWTLFNANPQVGKSDLILFDDVHAAGESVIAPWNLEIRKAEDGKTFEAIRQIIVGQIPPPQAASMLDESPLNRKAELVRHRDWLLTIDSIEELLDRQTKDTALSFPWTRLRGRLANCFCFISAESVLIRPWAPPTFELPEFSGASRRVYLSATLDQWGHIEHTMGIGSVTRVTTFDVPVPGRRLILNSNRLLPKLSDQQRILNMAKRSDKILILCRYKSERNEVRDLLTSGGYSGKILGSGPNLEDDIESFKRAKCAALVLANRYDGIDLGNGSCRNLVLWKLPLSVGLMQAFTTDVWRMKGAAEARARHRLHQGMGRCTRRDSDAVVVGLVGSALIEFLLRPEVRDAMPKRVRAELVVCDGLTDPSVLDDLISACIERTPDWKDICSQMDAEAQRYPEAVQPDAKLMEVHRREATYNEAIWTRNYAAAAGAAQKAAQELVSAQQDSSAAPWFYLAAVASDLQHFSSGGTPYSAEGTGLLREANSRADGRTWFGELSTYVDPPVIAPLNEAQVEGISNFLKKFATQTTRLDETLQEAEHNLESNESADFHRGLRALGESLGFEAVIPSRAGGPDVVWSITRMAVAIFEAKTDKRKDSSLSINEVRQIISLPRETMANEGVSLPPGLMPICITDCKRIANSERHELSNFSVVKPGKIRTFATTWFKRLSVLHKRSVPGTPEYRVVIEAAMNQLGAAQSRVLASLGATVAERCLEVKKTSATGG